MERRIAAGQPGPGALTLESTAALRALAGGAEEPLLLGVYPTFRTNPYQSLLYQRAREHGIAPVLVRQPAQLRELVDLQRSGLPTILHLHWLHPILRDAGSPKAAAKLVDEFVGVLDSHAAAGGRLAWTVHNVLSHEVRHEAEEVRLCAEVAARSHVVHVMSERTPEAVAGRYELPRDRLLVVPHMSYEGAYEDHVSRLDARHELGLLPDDVVYLALGYIRPYKGLETLLDAWQSLALGAVRGAPGRRRLVIAGEPADDAETAGFVERAALDPSVLIDARPIPSPEIQVFMRAADVAVLPYRRSLNSGALLLALTFGLPAIVPAGSSLADLVEPTFARTYDPDAPMGLADAIGAAAELVTPEARDAAEAAAASVHPAEISRRFAVGLRELLGT